MRPLKPFDPSQKFSSKPCQIITCPDRSNYSRVPQDYVHLVRHPLFEFETSRGGGFRVMRCAHDASLARITEEIIARLREDARRGWPNPQNRQPPGAGKIEGNEKNADYFMCTILEQCCGAYRKARENGASCDNPARPLPLDGNFEWVTSSTSRKKQISEVGTFAFTDSTYHEVIYHGCINYTEGPGDRAWMDEKDRTYCARMKQEEKEAFVRREREESEKVVKPHCDRAAAAMEAGQWREALTALNEAIRLSPDPKYSHNRDAYFMRGRARCALGDYEGCIQDNTIVIKANNQFAAAFSNRGAARRALNFLVEALNDFNEAIRLDPRNAHYRNGRAMTLEKSGEYKRALKDYTKAIHLAPGEVSYLLGRAGCFIQKGEFRNGIHDCNVALGYSPSNPAVFGLRGTARENVGEVSEALSDYEQAAKLGSPWAKDQALRLKTALLEEEKRREEALEVQRLLERQHLEAQAEADRLQEKERFTQALAMLKSEMQRPDVDARQLNQRFKALEVQAFTEKKADFFLIRGQFVDALAQKECNETRKKVFLSTAIVDYRQAMSLDPFIEEAAERVEALEKQLQERAYVEVPAAAAAVAPVPSLSAEDQARLEAMKVIVRAQLAQAGPALFPTGSFNPSAGQRGQGPADAAARMVLKK